jgi:hypothetical protein
MTSPKTEYQAKVTFDTGIARARVPTPLLTAMGARPGDYMSFQIVGRREVVMRLARARGKSAKGRTKRRTS